VSWREIWERKGARRVEEYDLETLMELDGFDCGAGKMSTAELGEVADLVRKRLNLRPGMSLLEVGCGAGALLWCLRQTGATLKGVDYAENQIRHARRAIPRGEFRVAEATRLPFRADAIVCHSVFQYFPTFAYADRVLREFRRKAPVSLILDIPDLATRDQSIKARTLAGSKPGRHLYLPRSFFAGCNTWTNGLSGYGNAPFRFHALLQRSELAAVPTNGNLPGQRARHC